MAMPKEIQIDSVTIFSFVFKPRLTVSIGSTVREFTGTTSAALVDTVNAAHAASSVARDDAGVVFSTNDVHANRLDDVITVVVRHPSGVQVLVKPTSETFVPVTSSSAGVVGQATQVDTSSASSFLSSLDVTSLLIGACVGVVVAK